MTFALFQGEVVHVKTQVLTSRVGDLGVVATDVTWFCNQVNTMLCNKERGMGVYIGLLLGHPISIVFGRIFFSFFFLFSLFSFLNYAKMVEDILLGFFAFILGPKALATEKIILGGGRLVFKMAAMRRFSLRTL